MMPLFWNDWPFSFPFTFSFLTAVDGSPTYFKQVNHLWGFKQA
jgi:hypothetical protein